MGASREAEAAGFDTGTADFCVFAMEVEPRSVVQATTRCSNGTVIGYEVTLDSPAATAHAAGYTTKHIQQMLACLRP